MNNRTKTLVVGAFVSVLVIGTTVFASSSNPGSEADPITTKSYVDTQLNSKIGSLQGELNTANGSISDLQKKIKALEDKVASQTQTPTTPAPTKPTPSPTPAPSYKTGVVTASTSLNVRSGASTGNSKVGSLRSGASVTILTSKSVSGATWHQIKAGTLTGWVHGAYIKIK